MQKDSLVRTRSRVLTNTFLTLLLTMKHKTASDQDGGQLEGVTHLYSQVMDSQHVTWTAGALCLTLPWRPRQGLLCLICLPRLESKSQDDDSGHNHPFHHHRRMWPDINLTTDIPKLQANTLLFLFIRQQHHPPLLLTPFVCILLWFFFFFFFFAILFVTHWFVWTRMQDYFFGAWATSQKHNF